MARELDDWVGKDDDTAIPPRVRVRVFDKKKGRCHACGRSIRAGERWTCEHLIALINWRKTDDQPHGNRESNLDVTCCNCLPIKNAADQAEKSEVYQDRKKHILPKEPGRASAWRRPPPLKQAAERCRACGQYPDECACPPPQQRSSFRQARRA